MYDHLSYNQQRCFCVPIHKRRRKYLGTDKAQVPILSMMLINKKLSCFGIFIRLNAISAVFVELLQSVKTVCHTKIIKLWKC